MLKIAVIGGRDTVMGFKALGLMVRPVTTSDEAREALHSLTRGDSKEEVAIIYLEETFAAELEPEIARYKDKPSPAIILIPGRDGTLGLGLSALRSAVEKAVGSNIL